ncbi:MAG: glycosyltransferase [Spirochaetes bacterium]|nr:glycosyltransferase [Spirochaetota bacterium]
MKNVILIKPYFRDFYYTKNRNFPYGLFLIGSILENMGIDVKILDLSILKKKSVDLPIYYNDLKKFYKKDVSSFSSFNKFYHFGFDINESIKIIKNIMKKIGEPIFIGISNFAYPYSFYGDELSLKIRDIYKGYLVAGGIGSSYLEKEDEDIIDIKDLYDFIFILEADVSIKKFVENYNNFERKEFKDNISNLFSKKYSIHFRINFPQDFEIESIKNKDIFRKFLINLEEYFGINAKRITEIYPHFSLTFSRGCPYKCNFCYNKSFNIPYRKREIDNILEEIEIAHKNGFTKFNIDDDTFFYDKDFSYELLRKIQKEFNKKIELYFYNGFNFHHLEEKDLKFLSKIKIVKFITFSIGSVGIKTQEEINRPFITNFLSLDKSEIINEFNDKDNDSFKSRNIILNLLKKYKIDSQIFFITPFKNQNIIEVFNNFLFILSSGNNIGISIYYPTPSQKENLFYKKKEAFRSTFLNFKDFNLSREEIFVFYNFERLFNFLLNFFYKKFIENFNILKLNNFLNSILEKTKYSDLNYISKNNQLKRETLSIIKVGKIINDKKFYFINYKETENLFQIINFEHFFKDNNNDKLSEKIYNIVSIFVDYILNSEFTFHFNNFYDLIYFLLFRKKNSFYITINNSNYKSSNKFDSKISFNYKFNNLVSNKIKKISIIIPFYNRYKLFLFCLYSIFFQSIFINQFFKLREKNNKKDEKINYIDFEILIVDDGSEIIKANTVIKKLRKHFIKNNYLIKFDKFIDYIFASNFPGWLKDQYNSIFKFCGIIKDVKKNIYISYNENRILYMYIKNLLMKNLKIIKLKHNFGVSYARNIGIKKSTGDIIFFLDSDDIFTPFKIKKHIDLYEEKILIDGVINEEGWVRNNFWINKKEEFKIENFMNNFLNDNFGKKIKNNKISISSISLKKEFLKAIGLVTNKKYFNINKLYLEDFDFFKKYLTNKNIVVINDILNIKNGGNFYSLSFIYRKEIHKELKNY